MLLQAPIVAIFILVFAALGVITATITLAPPRSATVSKPCRSYSFTAGLSGMTLRLIRP